MEKQKKYQKALNTISGIHHITMLCESPEDNVVFYREVLGLKLVKQTVNFDDPFTYHLYYGDDKGSPGTLLTFFPYQGIGAGRHGNNEIRKLGFAISPESYTFWKERLEKKSIAIDTFTRFGNKTISFSDNAGLEIELVVTKSTLPSAPLLKEHAIKGLYSIQLYVPKKDAVESLLKEFSYTHEKSEENIHRYKAQNQDSYVDIVENNEAPHVPGAGTVHHLAFQVPDNEQKHVQKELHILGYNATEIVDREYFQSIYFRTHEMLLFEIATTGPGMFIDEKELGSELRVPKQHTDIAQEIKKRLHTL
ncbi:MAG: VOC family protein [Candidatus Woesearchaeota archaeon]